MENHMSMNSMKMFFHFGYGDQFLFEKLVIDSKVKLWAICGALFLAAIIFEAIKYIRCVRCGCRVGKTHCVSDSGDINDADTQVRLTHNCYVGRFRDRHHRVMQTLLHMTQTIIGFIIMLSVMSFNVCVIFAILLGTAVGYYIFYRPYNEQEAIDSCH